MKGFKSSQGVQQDSGSSKSRGKNFLTQAKHDHVALFEDFALRSEEYETVEEYTVDLQQAAWLLAEEIAKQSYRNGIARGTGLRREQ